MFSMDSLTLTPSEFSPPSSSLEAEVETLEVELASERTENPAAVEAPSVNLSKELSKKFSRSLVGMKGLAYCNATYPLHYTRLVTQRGHYKFVLPDREDAYQTVLFGEVLSMADGTKLSAFGNYNTSWSSVAPITDKTLVKDILALGPPSAASKNLLSQYDNQIISFHQMRQVHVDEESNDRRAVVATIPILKPLEEGGRERISITLPLKYSSPERSDKSKASTQVTAKKRVLDDVDDDSNDVDDKSGRDDAGDVIQPTDELVKLKAFYDPRVLYDYGGPYFALKKNKLQQHDIRDVAGNLIPPWRQYEALKPGTLVAVVANINSFNYEDPGKLRKNYQFNAITVRVLADSKSEVETRFKRMGPQADTNAGNEELVDSPAAALTSLCDLFSNKQGVSSVKEVLFEEGGSGSMRSDETVGKDDMEGVELSNPVRTSKRRKRAV